MSDDNFNFEDDFEFEIDFADVKELEPLPDDFYFVSVTSAKPARSNANNPKITLQLAIQDGVHEGRSIYDDLTFTPKSMFRIKQAMLAMDFPDDFKGGIDPEDFVGQSVKVLVQIQPGNGVNPETGDAYPPRNRVKKYLKLTADELELFA